MVLLGTILLASALRRGAQDALPRIALGQVVEGAIEDGDPVVETDVLVTRYADAPVVGRAFQLVVDRDGPVTIELRSYSFDAYLVLRDAEGRVLAEDDDGLVRTHSRLVVPRLEAGTTCLLLACALHGGRGPFQLSCASGEPPPPSSAGRAALELEEAEWRVAAIEAVEGADSPRLARALHALGLAWYERGAYGQARPLWERSLAITEKVRGPDHPETAASLNNLATVLEKQGDLSAARPLLERALAIFGKAFGPEDPDTISTLCNLGVLLQAQGDYAGARPLLERALAICEEAFGPEHPDTADSLSYLAALLQLQGEFAAARPLLERALAIRERVLGPEHPAVATCLNNLGTLCRGEGDYAAAQQFLERALAINEQALGPEHPETVISLNNLAMLLQDQGDLASARPLFECALAIHEKVLGPDHPSTANSLNSLARLLVDLGDSTAARPLFERALGIRERVFGPEHPETATTLNNLAVLLLGEGELSAARPLFERALAIREKALGPEHPDVGSILSNLAWLLDRQGDSVAARPLYERALAIKQEALGPDHSELAATLGNLGALFLKLNDHVAARPLLERALAIREKTLGLEHPETAASLSNLALLLLEHDDFASARPLLERALAIREKAFGAEHPDTASVLSSLGWLHFRQGDLAGARSCCERARAILEKALGPEHPETALSLYNLARVLHRQGDPGGGRPLMERALAIWEKTLGPEHPLTVGCANSLALLLVDQGQSRAAWELARHAQRGRGDRIETVLASMSEDERYPYLASLLWQLELRLSVARRIDDPGAGVEAYDRLLEWKGRIGRLLVASREQLASRMGGESREILERLRRCQAELSCLAFETGIEDRTVRERRLGELRAEHGRLERELLRSTGSSLRDESVDFETVRSSLEPRSALVDFFAHRLYRPGEGAPGTWSANRITVWITRPGADAPIAVDLGPAAQIEHAVGDFLQDLVARRDSAGAAGEPGLVAHRGVAAGGEGGSDSGVALRALLWDPIAPYLADLETIFVSPDGALGTLPFETLPLADGSLAVEHHAFVYFPDASTLGRPREDTPELASLLAVGGIDFRERADWKTPEARSDEAASTLRGSFADSWLRLPATAHESRVVFGLHEEAFGDEGRRLLLQGDEPSEERLEYELERFAVLHLATHGFFRPEGVPSMWEAARDAAGTTALRMSPEVRRVVGRYPGLLSGLVCAGVNRSGDPDDAEGDDGYLTAEEVGWLDLSGVELVVLSACETGLGRPQSGEGLLGLRRAFHTAGARTVISSLWSVQDESTADLMRDFYENLWAKGMGRHEALRAAQLAMLERSRAGHGDALPATWGAFVLSGEWR